MGESGKYKNVNPYTKQYQGRADSAASGMENFQSSYDPNAAFREINAPQYGAQQYVGDVAGAANPLTGMAFGAYSPIQQQLNAQAAQQAQAGIGNAAQQFSTRGALNSGAAAAAMGQAAAQPFADVQNQLGMAQLGLAGNLLGGVGQAGQFGAGQNLQGQQANQQALLQAQMGNLTADQARLQGMQGALGYYGQMASPQMEYQKSGWEKGLDYTIAGTNAISGFF